MHQSLYLDPELIMLQMGSVYTPLFGSKAS